MMKYDGSDGPLLYPFPIYLVKKYLPHTTFAFPAPFSPYTINCTCNCNISNVIGVEEITIQSRKKFNPSNQTEPRAQTAKSIPFICVGKRVMYSLV